MPYAIGLSEKNLDWNSLKDFSSHYGSDLQKNYSSGWEVPNKDLLDKIWENKKQINESIRQISEKIPTLTDQEYWSSSADNNSAFYQIFDDEGKQDHTTKDHQYAVRAVRKWSKA